MPVPPLPDMASISLKQYLEEPQSLGPPPSSQSPQERGSQRPLTGEFPNKPATTTVAMQKHTLHARRALSFHHPESRKLLGTAGSSQPQKRSWGSMVQWLCVSLLTNPPQSWSLGTPNQSKAHSSAKHICVRS